MSGCKRRWADFSAALLGRLGVGLVTMGSLPLLAGGLPPNYGEVLQKSLYFYEAQMAGPFPEGYRVPWRGPAGMTDGFAEGVDLRGGFFDAGDHVKFGLPMTYTTTMLAWSLILSEPTYEKLGQEVYAKRNLRYVADWIMRAHSRPNEFWGQVGNGGLDHAYWGPPEVMPMARPAYKIDASCPGSDLAGEAAAALAATSMVFSKDDPEYASKALGHAIQLYNFADTFRGRYSDCITDASTYYRSWSGFLDELVWGALWLYQATGDQSYLQKAESIYPQIQSIDNPGKPYRWTISWDDKTYGTFVLLSQLTGKPEYESDAERWLDFWTQGYQGQRITYTPGGLAYLDSWGALRYAANTSFLALVYADHLKEKGQKTDRAEIYTAFARRQIDYALGDNPSQRSYVVGYGRNPPQQPHHRAAHGSWTNSLQSPAQTRHTLFGALVGGPDRNDTYTDDRGQYTFTEVATDYNAAFTGALALLTENYGGEAKANFPPPPPAIKEYAIDAKVNSRSGDYLEIATRIENQTAYPPRVPKNLRFRYVIDLTEIPAKLRDPSLVKITTAYNQATSVSNLQLLDASRNLYYIEVSFAGQNIAPAGQSESRREVQFRLNLPASWRDSWNENNDPSFQGIGLDWQKSDAIMIFE